MTTFIVQHAKISRMEEKYRVRYNSLAQHRMRRSRLVQTRSALLNDLRDIELFRNIPRSFENQQRFDEQYNDLRFKFSEIRRSVENIFDKIANEEQHIFVLREKIDRLKNITPNVRIVRVLRGQMSMACRDACPICLDIHLIKEVTKTNCGHYFGGECFARWTKTRHGLDCPCCRRVVLNVDVFKTRQYGLARRGAAAAQNM